MTALILATALFQLQVSGPSADSIDAIRKAARRAESEFERLARQLAPVKFSSMDGTQCDEIVGRFCLRYDSGVVASPPEEPGRVTLARRFAIEALRHAFSYHAAELETSGPLIRYLVEDDRASEAVSAARTFAALSGDSVWGPLLLGFALHAATADTAAARWFEAGLRNMPPDDRARVLDLEWLLSYDDRRRYKRMDAESRSRFEAMLWAFADPLYLTPGNERRNQHIARHVWSRALERAPVVGGMVRWGRDLEELTVRYGVPAGRSRSPGSMGRQSSLVEHFDPDQLAYVPEDLIVRGLPPTPPPGETWTLEEPRSRSGFAPATIRRLRPLDHQITRFPMGDSVLVRVDAQVELDSVAAGASTVRVGFWLLEDAHREARSAQRDVIPAGDTVRFAAELAATPGEYLYSAEVLDTVTRFGARARYLALLAQTTDAPLLSEPLLAAPFASSVLPVGRADPALRPVASLVFGRGDTIGLYAEARGLATGPGGQARYRVELALRRADRASLPARVVSWLGARLGLGGQPDVPARLSWTAHSDTPQPVVIAVDFPLDRDATGLYLLSLRLTDQVRGTTADTEKLIRIEKDR